MLPSFKKLIQLQARSDLKGLALTVFTFADRYKLCDAEQNNEQQSKLLHGPQMMRPVQRRTSPDWQANKLSE